jgi:hypothetical protein
MNAHLVELEITFVKIDCLLRDYLVVFGQVQLHRLRFTIIAQLIHLLSQVS